jgi:hypothetical protein
MTLSFSKLVLPASLFTFLALAACGGDGTSAASNAAAANTASAPVTASSPVTASAPDAASTPAVTTQPGKWASATAGAMLDVTLADLHPTQAALGYDQIYYKLGRYEVDATKKFDDYCADEGLGGLVSGSSTSTSKLTDSATYACTTTDTAKRDTTVLNPVVIGPNGDSLYLTDGHHGLSTYYETPDGGPTLHAHVIVKDNLSAYAGDAFWAEMQTRGYTRLKDASGAAILPAQLPSALGLTHGMQDDKYRSLVYFTRDIGYSKPTPSTDFLEFFWADWLRAGFPLNGYTLSTLGTVDPDPSTAGTGYLNAVWNASTKMVAAADPIIDGKTGAQLGKLATINNGKAYNKGEFGDLSQPMSAKKPGKIAYMLNYKTVHGIK